jgi:hypothetical protein
MAMKDILAVAMMCAGVWSMTHAYSLYNGAKAKAARMLSDVFKSGITQGDMTAFAFAIGGVLLVVGALFLFGEKGKKGKR